jgi:tetratricopeptide (TPR) repeat protein
LRRKKVFSSSLVILSLFIAWSLVSGAPSAQTRNEEGLAKLKSFDFTGAVSAFQSALTAEPDSLVLRVNLGLALFYSGDFDQAKEQLFYVEQRDSDDPYMVFLQAVIADREGRLTEATRLFRRLLEIAPTDPGSYYHLGLIALREERFEDAIELFQSSLDGNPSCTSSLYNLGRALISSGKKKEGRAVLKKFQELQSQEEPGLGGGMGDPSVLVGKYGQARMLLED